jgi:uncharacterized protein with HEPN domain
MPATAREGLSKDDFPEDTRTRHAVLMLLSIIGEATAKVMNDYPDFTRSHPEVKWRGTRNIRNRIIRGYFDINLDMVWDAAQTMLPRLLKQLPALIHDATTRL